MLSRLISSELTVMFSLVRSGGSYVTTDESATTPKSMHKLMIRIFMYIR